MYEPYSKAIERLEHVYLEDSYILSVREFDDCVEFNILAVLTEDHPLYHRPKPNEQYCYREARLQFLHCREVNWLRKTFRPAYDANGVVDFGNFDTFEISADKVHLEGEWGELKLRCGLIDFKPVVR